MSKTILLLESDLVVASEITMQMKKAGIVVHTVSSPDETLDKLKGQSYSAIVLDYGLQSSRKAHLVTFLALHFPDIPRVLMSEHNLSEIPREVRVHCAEFVEKPFPISMLVQICKHISVNSSSLENYKQAA